MTTCHITNVVASERPTQKTWHTLNDKIIKRNSNTQLSAKPAYNLKSEYFLITAEAITENVLVEETERDIHSSAKTFKWRLKESFRSAIKRTLDKKTKQIKTMAEKGSQLHSKTQNGHSLCLARPVGWWLSAAAASCCRSSPCWSASSAGWRGRAPRRQLPSSSLTRPHLQGLGSDECEVIYSKGECQIHFFWRLYLYFCLSDQRLNARAVVSWLTWTS